MCSKDKLYHRVLWLLTVVLMTIWGLNAAAQWTEPERIAPLWSSEWEEPWISNDNTRLYVSDRIGIYVAHRVHPWGWDNPVRLPDHINFLLNVRSPCESPTGDTLYFTGWDWQDPNGWDVYFSVRADTGWGPVQSAGPEVNTSEHQKSVGISRDGSLLLVQHTFLLGYHEKQEDGSWGPNIDFGLFPSLAEDQHPSMSPDNSRLYFARSNHNHGDIRMSYKVDGVWQPSEALPNPLINGTFTQENDPCLMNGGRTLIFRKGTSAENYLYSTTDTTIINATEYPPSIAQEFHIAVYPNPFNPTTTICFDLTHPGMVKLNVFDVTGRLVSTLVDDNMIAGEHRVIFDGAGLGSGIYFARMEAGSQTMTRKMALIR